MAGFHTSLPALDIPEIGIGMLGYAFMGRAHSNALQTLASMMYPPPMIPKLVALCGRNESAVSEVTRRFGYAGYYTRWQDMLEDDRIRLFDNGGPNNAHHDPCIQAAAAGMHILCEKPLARTAEESKAMLDAVNKAGVKHMVAFNYRFVPAIRQAYELLRSGALGQIYHFRATYLQDWLLPIYETPRLWRMDKSVAGTGAIGDLASHIIDLARFLVGSEIRSVSAKTKTFIPERPMPDGSGMGTVNVDDAFAAVIEFESGVIGTLEGSRLAAGRKNYNVWEINGENGSIRFNLEQMNNLEVYWTDAKHEQITALLKRSSRSQTIPGWLTGGRPAISSAGNTPSSTRLHICWIVSSTIKRLRPSVRTSKTAFERRSFRMRLWNQRPRSGRWIASTISNAE